MEEKDNSWYECGELPPVGANETDFKCVGTYYDSFKKYVVVAHVGCIAVVCVYETTYGIENYPKAHSLHRHHFKPIRTEREKFIDAVKRFHNISHVIDADAYFGGLYDAGFRAPEEKCQS